MRPSTISEHSLVILITLVCLVPFLNKAFNSDDPVFIWTAKQISTHPFDFYGFKVNWYDIVSPMAEINKNPPGVSYYLALAGSLFGWSELALHSSMLIPAVAAALGMFYLARLFCAHPLLATLAGVLTPVFLVSASSVMCDIAMLALLTWSVVFWIRGVQTNRHRDFCFSAVLITACSLTKYFGIAVLPLLIAYTLAKKPRSGLWLCYLLIPITCLAAYQWITHLVYGRGLFGDAALSAAGFQSINYQAFISKGLIALSFTGGCFASALFFAPFLWSRRDYSIGSTLVILIFVYFLFVQKVGTFTIRDGDLVKWFFLAQLVIMVITGVSIIALALSDFLTFRNAESFLLLLWVFGTFIFAGFVNWSINARSILPMAPAVGILLMRRVDQRRNQGGPRKGILSAAWPLLPSTCIAIMIGWSDYQWAGTTRTAAFQISRTFEKRGNSTLWFLGHWGFQYYMEALNGKAIDLNSQTMMPGDILILPINNSYSPIRNISSFQQQNPLIGRFEVGPQQWVTTMSYPMGAGFYSHFFGPLPFAFGLKDPEKYYAFMLRYNSS